MAQDSIDYLEKLIEFPTVSRDSNLDLIAFVERELKDAGASCLRVASEDGRKANLLATVGTWGQPGIVLSGHSDVVPVEGQAWRSDPFRLKKSNGRLYGRGTADMKGFIACSMAMLREAARRTLAVPLHLVVSYDEEVGCLGVRRLLEIMAGLPFRPRFCIVGEPTSMQVVTAHKGKLGMKVECRGLEVHSALAPLGVNAVYLALDLIGELRTIQEEIALSGRRDGDYEVAHTTVHAGNIAGGEVINIVPNRCRFEYEIRHLPEDDPAKIQARLKDAAQRIIVRARETYADADIVLTPSASYPALDTPPDSDVVAFMTSLTGGNSTGKISFGTEAGLFQQRLGIPAVVCGPGNIAVAHKPDEYVEEDQMKACDAVLARLLERVSG
ncbi:MAG TPA: acetylornithine deacetylase [Aestuariivirgaceae bacterium]|jgi:acetylornithine deacetylase